MVRVFFIAIALSALVLGGVLRLADLSGAPLHADEATGARIVGSILESGRLRFDPSHFHGPLLHGFGAVVARGTGAVGWVDLEIGPLRSVTVFASLWLCFLPLATMPWIGWRATLWGTAFLAINPWLVYYSRIFIHETLLVGLLGAALLVLVAWWHRPSFVLSAAVGVLFGMAAATKETWVLAPAAWLLVALALRLKCPVGLGGLLRHGGCAALVFLIVLYLAYADFGRNPAGVLDFLQTYWSYEVTAGHEKPVGYYARLLFLPQSQGRFFWWTGGVVLLALAGCLGRHSRERTAIRFLCLSAGIQVALYSLLAYKTPWLMLVPVAHLALAAGLSVARFCGSPSRPVAVAVSVLGLVLLATDAHQARWIAHRLAVDARNPIAYVPTAPGLERWTGRSITWIESVGAADQTIAVVGTGYWPLPWYLRPLQSVGYWPRLPENASALPMVVALPDAADSVVAALAETHVALPEGLRADTIVFVLLRKDIWAKAVEGDAP